MSALVAAQVKHAEGMERRVCKMQNHAMPGTRKCAKIFVMSELGGMQNTESSYSVCSGKKCV